jgi:hypothetical protein
VPVAIASELSEYIIHGEDGVLRIRKIIIDDIEHARTMGDKDKVRQLNQVLAHFIASHPEYPDLVEQ